MATHTLTNDFSYNDPKTLAGKKGEEFTVITETGGWCTCKNAAGKTGLIPSSYLKPLPFPVASDADYVEAIHDYAGNPGDPRFLAFKAKDVMKIVKKAQGWWTCEIVTTGKSGLCPETFLKACAAPSQKSSPSPSPILAPASAPVPAPAPAPAPASAPVLAPTVDTENSAGGAGRGVNPIAAAAAGFGGLRKTPQTVTVPVTSQASPSLRSSPGPEPKPVSSTPSLSSSPSTSSPSSSSSVPSSSSSVPLGLALQENDLSSLLSTFDVLQQESNAVLRQQMEELADTKELVKRIHQSIGNR